MPKISNFFTISPTLFSVILIEVEVVCWCGLDLQLISDWWYWTPLHELIDQSASLIGELSVQVLCPFLHLVAFFGKVTVFLSVVSAAHNWNESYLIHWSVRQKQGDQLGYYSRFWWDNGCLRQVATGVERENRKRQIWDILELELTELSVETEGEETKMSFS